MVSTPVPPDALVDVMLPCPFCGRADLLRVESHPDRDLGSPGTTLACVRCRACGCAGPAERRGPGTRADAIANWNRRAQRADQQTIHVSDRPTGPDAKTVRILGRGMGFGRLMQLVEQEWRSVAGDGTEHSVGPCAALLMPCACASGCEWCGGSHRVTERVARAMRESTPRADLQNLQHIRSAINRTAYHGGLGLHESGRYLATMDRLLASFGIGPDDHGEVSEEQKRANPAAPTVKDLSR